MDLTGKIIKILPVRKFTTKSGEENGSQEFVIEMQAQFPKHCVLSIYGYDRMHKFNLMEGEVKKVHFDIDAREYNGRWYNTLSVWKVEGAEGRTEEPSPNIQNQVNIPAPQTKTVENNTNYQLPF